MNDWIVMLGFTCVGLTVTVGGYCAVLSRMNT